MSEITGQVKEVMDVKAYRKIPRLSFSSLKIYVENRKKFYKEEILGERKERESSAEMTMGNLTDVILTDKEHMDDYFAIASTTPPTGQLLTFVQEIFKVYKMNTNIDGHLIVTFKEAMEQAYENVRVGNGGKLRDKFETFVENFNSKGGKEYLKELIDGDGKQVVSIDDILMAEKIVLSLKTCPSTQRIVELEGKNVYSKLPILFNYRGRQLKAEIDKLEINHIDRIIHIYDYKCTAFVEHWIGKYLENKYYLQQALYRIAVKEWAEEQGLIGYEVGYMNFVCSDSINYYSPLIYQMNSDNYEQGINGFSVNGRKYKGVNQILDDISLSEETDNWNMSADNIRNNGIVNIPSFNNYA